jgi:RNAse (barnase) inhibitor barstar
MENRIHILLDNKIRTKLELLDAYSNALNFPHYFGQNWDSFWDCLSEFLYNKNCTVEVEHSKDFSLLQSDLDIYKSIISSLNDDNFRVIWN